MIGGKLLSRPSEVVSGWITVCTHMYRRGRVRKGKYYWERPGRASGREGGSMVNWLETRRFNWSIVLLY